MNKAKFPQTLTAKITDKQRNAIEDLAEVGEISIGEAARVLLDEGIKARAGAGT